MGTENPKSPTINNKVNKLILYYQIWIESYKDAV